MTKGRPGLTAWNFKDFGMLLFHVATKNIYELIRRGFAHDRCYRCTSYDGYETMFCDLNC